MIYVAIESRLTQDGQEDSCYRPIISLYNIIIRGIPVG